MRLESTREQLIRQIQRAVHENQVDGHDLENGLFAEHAHGLGAVPAQQDGQAQRDGLGSCTQVLVLSFAAQSGSAPHEDAVVGCLAEEKHAREPDGALENEGDPGGPSPGIPRDDVGADDGRDGRAKVHDCGAESDGHAAVDRSIDVREDPRAHGQSPGAERAGQETRDEDRGDVLSHGERDLEDGAAG